VPFITTVTESLSSAAKENDIDLMILNNRGRATAALRNAEVLIEAKVDVAIEFQRIADVAGRLSDKFQAAGIPLIAVDNPHPGAIYFGADNYKAGRIGGLHLGRWAVQHWAGKVDEIILVQSALSAVLEARILGIYDGLTSVLPRGASVPVSRYDTHGEYERTLQAIRKHLRGSRARRFLVGCVNDTCALAALEAFREFSRIEQCAVVGQDAVLEARQEMRRPQTALVGSVAYFPETYGERLLRLAVDVAENRKHAPAAVFTQHVLVTPSNVDKIYSNDLLLLGKPVH
jgi:ribose transport system substrate-binding protein